MEKSKRTCSLGVATAAGRWPLARTARERTTRVDGAAPSGDVRAAVGSLGVCSFASLRSAMLAGGRRSEPLRHDCR